MDRNDDERLPLFLGLYNGNYRRMCFFVKTLMPAENDLEDVMQEVSMILWKKFPSFQIGSNFIAWAFTVIQFEVLRWKKQKSDEQILFDGELLTAVAESIREKSPEELDARYAFLIECTRELPTKLHELIRERYYDNESVSEMAERRQRQVDTVYQQLCRVRMALRDCILKKIKKAGLHY